MTSQPYPIVTHLIERVAAWLQQRRALAELSDLDAAEFSRVAHEFGLAPADLATLVRRGVDGAEELPQMLHALGFDDAAVARIRPAQMLDMRQACMGCTHKRTCASELAAQTALAHYRDYCANAEDLSALMAAKT